MNLPTSNRANFHIWRTLSKLQISHKNSNYISIHYQLSLRRSSFRSFEEISILINGEHLTWRSRLSDPIMTGEYPMISYLDLRLEIDSEGRLRTNLYDKRDDFNIPIVKVLLMCSST